MMANKTMNTTYYTSTTIETTTNFFTTNTKDSFTIKNTTADIDFYYIWIIMFSLFVLIASTIIIKFWSYHFGRINPKEFIPLNSPSNSDKGRTITLKDDASEKILDTAKAILDEIENKEEEN
eukprot:805762_1